MDAALKAILIFLLNKKYIGEKHFPERKLIVSRTKWLKKDERKSFEREYKDIKRLNVILSSKKRTGKGSEPHISINPDKIKEIYEKYINP